MTVDRLRDIYDAYAPSYVERVTPIARYYDRVAKFLDTHSTGTVLDLGCGPGHLTAGLPATVDVIGLDLSSNMVALAQQARPAGRYLVHDLHAPLPLADASIDALVCAGVLDFCFVLDAVVAEIARVLRIGGAAFLTFADRRPHDPARLALSPRLPATTTMALYTRKELRRAFARWGLRPRAFSRGPGYYHRDYARDITYSFWELTRS